ILKGHRKAVGATLDSQRGVERQAGRPRLRRPAPHGVKWFTAAVWALVLASFLALPVLWNSPAGAQQAESKPAAPDKTAASTATTQVSPSDNADATITRQVNVVNVPVTVLGK